MAPKVTLNVFLTVIVRYVEVLSLIEVPAVVDACNAIEQRKFLAKWRGGDPAAVGYLRSRE